MRKMILLFLGCSFITALYAQTPVCVPDAKYKDSTGYVYPLPFDATLNPKGGIDKPACIGKPYDFVFTLRIPDTVALLGSRLRLDSIFVNPTTGISGLPAGITYACNPGNCLFKKNTLGCVILRGTTNAPANTYKLSFTLKVFVELFGGQDITYPNAALAPGEYNLRVLPATDAACRSSSTFDLTEVSAMSASPNPATLSTLIKIDAVESGNYQFEVTNLMGQSVFTTPLSIQRGINALELNTEDMPNGVYIYTLSKGNKKLSEKLIVNK